MRPRNQSIDRHYEPRREGVNDVPLEVAGPNVHKKALPERCGKLASLIYDLEPYSLVQRKESAYLDSRGDGRSALAESSWGQLNREYERLGYHELTKHVKTYRYGVCLREGVVPTWGYDALLRGIDDVWKPLKAIRMPGSHRPDFLEADPFTRWDRIDEYRGKDDTRVRVGVITSEGGSGLAEFCYVLHPTHDYAVTPVFTKLLYIGNDGIEVLLPVDPEHEVAQALDASDAPFVGSFATFRISDIDTVDKKPVNLPADAGYPEFFRSPMLHMSFVRADVPPVVRGVSRSNETMNELVLQQDLFGLERADSLQSNVALGCEVFRSMMALIAEYALYDDEIRRQLRTPDSSLWFPRVSTPIGQVRLTLETKLPEELSILTLSNCYGRPEVIGLRQDQSGEVVVWSGRTNNKGITPDNPHYEAVMQRTERAMNLYMTALIDAAIGSDITPERIHELRTKLGAGGLKAWSARRELRKASHRR